MLPLHILQLMTSIFHFWAMSRIISSLCYISFYKSRLTGSESQGQKEAACARQANATTGVLFTATNAVKFPSTVSQLSWALLVSYYRASTFLP